MLKKLNAAVDRFAYRHPRFGVPHLMKYIVIANVLVYLLAAMTGSVAAVSFLAFDWQAILHGEIWRLVTFIIMPGYYSTSDLLWVALFLYLYYMIGTTLEREWGTAKFNLYYLSGAVLTVIAGVVMGLATGSAIVAGAGYVNLSMFFAFAMLYPDTQFLILFIIPVKVKWLAWLDGAVFILSAALALMELDILRALLPVVAFLNFFVFFWDRICDEISYRRGRARYQTSSRTIHFKTAARQQRKKEAAQGYRHKCEVCGRTDTAFPDLQFRYCSKCAGYHCFCEDHIFNHTHHTG